MTPRLALLLKAPRLGCVKTRLAATVGDTLALRIYRQLVERQVAAVPALWPMTVYFDPLDAKAEFLQWLVPLRPGLDFLAQSNGDLGARLAGAFAHEFASGAQGVIAIGGDCPALDQAKLEAAATALDGVNTVIGPANDGGYYLIGLTKPCADLFADITWSTPEVLSQTLDKISKHNLSLFRLPELADVDDFDDWQRAVSAGWLPDVRTGGL